MAVEGKDAFGSLTLPSNTLCQLVGASSVINMQWQQSSGQLGQAYNGFRFFFCSGVSCTSNSYFDLPASGNPVAYAFTTTAGSTAGSLATGPSAYLSKIQWAGVSCLLCSNQTPIGTNFFQLGIGDANPPLGSRASVLGELNVTGNYRCLETTAPTGILSYGLFWCDSATHRLRGIFNNGVAASFAMTVGTLVNGNGVKVDANLNLIDDGGVTSLATVEYCGATTGATQACAKTVQTLPIILWGDVFLNAATSQSITTLPFTDALYSCSGSDLTTAGGVVSFSTYAPGSVTITETGGTNADHLRYQCVGH